MAEIEILVEAAGWRDHAGAEALVERAALAALAGSARRGGVSVLLADDAALRGLNHAFRGKDQPTNVLSFPAAPVPGDPAPALGDIALAYETCAREAAAEGKSLDAHLAHLVVHGVLHLLGHDHMTEAEADAMEAAEIRILAGLGYADPYADAGRSTP
ncbi:rRNA maturation RNase YbeY [Rhabdaerophilum calidifontis]|uniref:rRNA maturation RNase YbeY n=1 Tax=Rhabdaerophilum calidifontis TaxID=2604328 RepID=UPI00123B4C27|nr:rRNA maturation RNase YbeY [Rhabdaerophilum calidifontis]